MNRARSNLLSKTLKLLVCFLILKVTMDVLSNYHDYLPPNFDSAFLRGRASYFSGGYQWAFYSHIAAGPWTLVAGILLISERIRTGTPRLHRILGRVQVVTVLVFIVPSGIWMAAYAETGMVAGWGFATLALATGICAWCGWRFAVRRQFVRHRCWMMRCYVLLCSAVVLRLTAGVFTVARVDADWTYPLAAWASWTIPLLVFEATPQGYFGRRYGKPSVRKSVSQ